MLSALTPPGSMGGHGINHPSPSPLPPSAQSRSKGVVVVGGGGGGGGVGGGSNTSRTTPKLRAPLDVLDHDLTSLAASLAPSSEERQRHALALEAVRKVLQKEWPNSRVHLFGSTANDLCIGANNDIDVCIELPQRHLDAEGGSKGAVVERMGELFDPLGRDVNRGNSNLKIDGSSATADEELQLMGATADEEGGEFIDLHVISSARVPVVKACHGPTGVRFDVTVNNMLALANTRLLKTYANLDSRVRPLVFLVKVSHGRDC